jgi:hypothetical protein
MLIEEDPDSSKSKDVLDDMDLMVTEDEQIFMVPEFKRKNKQNTFRSLNEKLQKKIRLEKIKNKIRENLKEQMGVGAPKPKMKVKLIQPKPPIKPKGHPGLGALLRYLLEYKMYEEEKRNFNGKPF